MSPTDNLDGVTTEVREEDGITNLNLRSPVFGSSGDGNDGTFVDLTGDLFGDEDTSLGLLGSGGASMPSSMQRLRCVRHMACSAMR